MISRDPTYPLFPIISFFAFILGMVPLAWHLQAWNTGTCAFMFWASFACLAEFIDSIIWKGNSADVAPVWCDISTKFLLGAGIGVPASILCISRRLHSIATNQGASITRGEKRRAILVDGVIAIGIPVMVMVFHYIVQPHRYDIFEDIGCKFVIYNTLPAYFLVLMWPVVLGSISFIYSSLTLHSFYQRRLQFQTLLRSHGSQLNVSRYIRLLMLAIMDMLCTVPVAIFSIYIGTKDVKLAPWISWEDTHYNFSHVNRVPSMFWRSKHSVEVALELNRWLFPASVFIFFALFGFASEAKRHYRLVFDFALGPFKRSKAKAEKAKLYPLSNKPWVIDHIHLPRTPLASVTRVNPSSFAIAIDAVRRVSTDSEKANITY